MIDPKLEKYEFSQECHPRAVAFADFNFFGQSLLSKEFSKAIEVFDIIYCDGYWLYVLLKSLNFKVIYKPGPLFFKKFAEDHSGFIILSKYNQSDIDEVFGKNKLIAVELPFVDDVDDFNFKELSGFLLSDHIFVSLGCPKQELFIERIIKYLPNRVTCYAVGAALDFTLGREIRAPDAIQRLRLEFLWRLIISRRKQWKKWKNVPVVLIWYIKKLIKKIFMRC